VAESPAGIVDVAQQIILARLSEQFFGGVPRQAVRAFIPILNPPLAVDEVHTIADVIQQLSIEGWIIRENRILRIF